MNQSLCDANLEVCKDFWKAIREKQLKIVKSMLKQYSVDSLLNTKDESSWVRTNYYFFLLILEFQYI